MKLHSDYRVTVAAALGLVSPDVLNLFFKELGPVLDIFIRLGQFAVAVVTVAYIFKKMQTIPTKGVRKPK